MGNNSINRRNRFPIFFMVGLVNTAVDITIYLLLLKVGLVIVLANIISTSITLMLGYQLHKRATFKDQTTSKNSRFKFLIITLIGLWLLQPVAIYAVLWLLHTDAISAGLNQLYGSFSMYYDFVAKLAATSVPMIWNYVLYRKFVFNSNRQITS